MMMVRERPRSWRLLMPCHRSPGAVQRHGMSNRQNRGRSRTIIIRSRINLAFVIGLQMVIVGAENYILFLELRIGPVENAGNVLGDGLGSLLSQHQVG